MVRRSAEVRFWKSVNKNGPIHPVCGQCWVWTASTLSGYGKFYAWGRQISAHQFAYIRYVGDRGGQWVLHRCDNKLCIRPKHLFLGSPMDNSLDMKAKERQSRGEQLPQSKLTEELVVYVRRNFKRWSERRTNAQQLADELGITSGQVRRIVRGRFWKHVREES